MNRSNRRTTLRTRTRVGSSDPHQIKRPPCGLGQIVIVVAVVLMATVVKSSSATATVRSVVTGHGSGWEK